MPNRGSPRKSEGSAPSSRFSSLDKKQAKAFLDFCKRAAADENLAFLALVKKFKKGNASARIKYYHKIEVAHLHPTTSIAPVNLDASQLRAIQNQVDAASKNQTKLPRTLFDEAESFITELIDTDLLPKFQTRSRANSTVY